MDASNTQGDWACDSWPVIPAGQASLMTPPNLAPYDHAFGSPIFLPTIPSFLTYISGSSGDLEDNTLHDNDVNIGPFVADLTACVPSLHSSSLLAPNLKKVHSSSPVARRIRTISGQEDLTFELTIFQPSCPDLSKRFTGGEASILKRDLGLSFSENAHSPDRSRQTLDSAHSFYPEVSTPLRSILAYKLMGVIGQAPDRKVLVTRKRESKGDLFVLRAVRSAAHPSNTSLKKVEELALLRLVTQASRINQLGSKFLQVLVDDFQDDNYLYTILEYYPTTLSTPDLATRFRILRRQRLTSPACDLLPSISTSRSSGSMAPARAVYLLQLLLAEISLGLLYLHKHGIVHQDIKPATIMISDTGHVVIGNFGAASRLPLSDPEISPTSTPGLQSIPKGYGPIVLQPDDFVTFTPLYAAPELRQRGQDGLVIYDERADWWSVGVLVYELVTGTAPPHLSYDISTLRSDEGNEALPFGNKVSVFEIRTDDEWCPPLESFLDSLLTHDPTARLSGQNVKSHPFFDPIAGLWSEVAALKHPPCPKPWRTGMEETISFKFNPQCVSSPHHHSQILGASRSFGVRQVTQMELGTRSAYLPANDFGHRPHQRKGEIGLETNDCQLTDDCEVSDDGSEIQALPSTASIYPNLGWSDTLPCEARNTGGNLTVDIPGNESVESTRRRYFDGRFASSYHPDSQLRSPFSPQRAPSISKHNFRAGREDGPGRSTNDHSRFISGHPVALPQLVLPEKITLSLLEAMDKRDHRDTMCRQHPMMKRHKVPTRRARPTHTPQGLIRTFTKRVLRGLRFW